MAFFNKKEDVLQLKLTQHGKRLLAKGQLKPVYYAFFDDNVLYNADFAAFIEHQDAAESRIQEETPSLKTQHMYYGAETSLKTIDRQRNSLSYGTTDTSKFFIEPEQHGYTFISAPIGTSDLAEEKAPSFKVAILDGKLTGSVHYVTGAFQTLRIPQLDVDLNYKIHISDDSSAHVAPNTNLSYRSQIDLGQLYEDGTAIVIQEDFIMLQVEELMSEYSNENFDIEVYLMEEEDTAMHSKTPGISSPNKKDVLSKLSFSKKPEEVVEGILLDPEELTLPFQNIDIDSSYVEHFFDIFVDNEIDPEAFCAVRKTIEVNKFMEDIDIECKEDTRSAVAVYDAIVSTDPEECG
jgi:hypothetical protein